MRMIGK